MLMAVFFYRKVAGTLVSKAVSLSSAKHLVEFESQSRFDHNALIH